MEKENLIPIGLRMRPSSRELLDELCRVNARSRREIIEILIEKAHKEWRKAPTKRINPL